MFPSRTEAWRAVRGFVEAFCGEAGVARETCLRANLVIEELFVNTVKHGLRGGSDAPVWLTLELRGDRVAVHYEDNAPPFNPFGRAPDELRAAPAHAQAEGGLGVILANSLAASADYAYLFGRNRIRFEIPR
ncbi:MAG TPA: ATP-binding protein [Usitatibacter sp.]|nr:ATP-binding protein [Usitatibacter sp.]